MSVYTATHLISCVVLFEWKLSLSTARDGYENTLAISDNTLTSLGKQILLQFMHWCKVIHSALKFTEEERISITFSTNGLLDRVEDWRKYKKLKKWEELKTLSCRS